MRAKALIKARLVRPRKRADGICSPANQTHKKSLAWIVWIVSVSFVLFQFFLQLSSGEIVDGLMKSFSLSALGGGVLASSYYYVYVALQTPGGALIDRFGPRRLLSLGALVVVIGAVLFGSTHELVLAILGRLLMGCGAAFAFVGSLNLIGKWFPPHRFGLMASIAETIGMMGTIFGSMLLAEVVQRIGWRESMLGAAAVAGFIGLLIWTIVRDCPPIVTESVAPQPKIDLWRDIKVLMKKKTAWINGIYGGLMFCVITVFVALWAIPFFQVEHHYSLLKAATVANIVFLGAAIGSPLMGWLDSQLDCRRTLLVGSGVATTLFLVLIIYVPNLPTWLLMTLMFLLGMACTGYILTLIIANEIAPVHIRGTSIGFVNTLTVGTAPLLQPLVGLVLYLLADSFSKKLGVLHYSISEYQIALAIIPAATLFAAWLGRLLPKRVVQ